MSPKRALEGLSEEETAILHNAFRILKRQRGTCTSPGDSEAGAEVMGMTPFTEETADQLDEMLMACPDVAEKLRCIAEEPSPTTAPTTAQG